TCFTASARNSSVYCLLLPINTSVIAMNYGNRMSTKGWPVQRSKKEIGRLNLLPTEICEQLAMGLALTDLCAENVRLLRQANDRGGQEEQFEVLCNSVQGAAKAFAAASARMKLLMVSNERVEAHVDTPHA
ncbi:hypothetical protein, partial [Stenotrophomonas maltophilia]|uniref:hypothetical protein n=1 Tax=Stenotrophomonas maltophilia TaxID=40324 RepID=UPI0039E1EE00